MATVTEMREFLQEHENEGRGNCQAGMQINRFDQYDRLTHEYYDTRGTWTLLEEPGKPAKIFIF
mgnify:CR=1 FL=1